MEQGEEFNSSDEEMKRIHGEHARYKFWLNNLITEVDAKTYIDKFQEYEQVEFEPIFQNILYFRGVENTEINEDLTNKLFWKKARKFWTKDMLEFINNYNPFGPKDKPVKSFAIINRLINVFKGIDVEKVKDYSIILAKLLEIMNICKIK